MSVRSRFLAAVVAAFAVAPLALTAPAAAGEPTTSLSQADRAGDVQGTAPLYVRRDIDITRAEYRSGQYLGRRVVIFKLTAPTKRRSTTAQAMYDVSTFFTGGGRDYRLIYSFGPQGGDRLPQLAVRSAGRWVSKGAPAGWETGVREGSIFVRINARMYGTPSTLTRIRSALRTRGENAADYTPATATPLKLYP